MDYGVALSISSIVHNGLTINKSKGSKRSLLHQQLVSNIEEESADKKGVHFVVRKKEYLQTDNGVKGYIVTSLESMLNDVETLSHWTPNSYRWGTYTNDNRTHIKGFSEDNLLQINCFVIDIDDHSKVNRNLILNACEEIGLQEPTFILKTTKGYQVYFTLTQPCFISNANGFKSLRVAKRVSRNLKIAFKEKIPATDIGCNDFGFFRIPKEQDLVYISDKTIDYGNLMTWSMKQGEKITQYNSSSSMENSIDITKRKWFDELIHLENIKGGKGKYGRNNTFFTLALACYQSKKSEQYTIDLLDQFNSRLHYPTSMKEVKKSIKSAFSGKYRGVDLDYVKYILQDYADSNYTLKSYATDMYNSDGKVKPQFYKKHKKTRENRKNSHYNEWEEDVIKFINKNIVGSQLEVSYRSLSEALNIPLTSLKHVLNTSKKIVKRVKGKGRYAITKLVTVEILIANCIKKRKENKNIAHYSILVNQVINDIKSILTIKFNFYREEINGIIMGILKSYGSWENTG